MTFNVVSWNTRANHNADDVVIKFPVNELCEISFYFGNLRNM